MAQRKPFILNDLTSHTGTRYIVRHDPELWDTERLARGYRVRRLVGFERLAQRKLTQLDTAATLDFLQAPPGNRLDGAIVEARTASMTSGGFASASWTETPTTPRSSITTYVVRGGIDMTRLEPVHLGEGLKRDFMEPFGLFATALAKAIGVTSARINFTQEERHAFAVR